jgi:hypothetical protein
MLPTSEEHEWASDVIRRFEEKEEERAAVKRARWANYDEYLRLIKAAVTRGFSISFYVHVRLYYEAGRTRVVLYDELRKGPPFIAHFNGGLQSCWELADVASIDIRKWAMMLGFTCEVIDKFRESDCYCEIIVMPPK